MNGIFFLLAAVLLLPACCTTVGAAGVFLMRPTQEPKTRRMLCGMAAGIMLAASVWSLLLPAIQRAEEGLLPAWLPPTAGLVIGAVGLLRLEQAAGTLLTGAGAGHCGRMVLAVTLHNLPEGMVVGLAAALALSGEADAMSGALALALAGWVQAALPWLMSAAAGCMVCVTAQEMIPEAVEADEPAGVISVVLGFALMMALDVAL